MPEPYNGTTKEPKAAVPKNKKRRRKKKKKKAPDEPADEEYDPEKYTEDDEVLGSDSDESGCESDGAVVASDGGEGWRNRRCVGRATAWGAKARRPGALSNSRCYRYHGSYEQGGPRGSA